jgi:long-chain acyl-CoA synthetase
MATGNFYERFLSVTERFPDRVAVEVQRRESLDTLTYRELREMAERVAAFLAARGIAPGDRCAILSDNDARWVTAYLGVQRLGAVAVPLDTAYKSKQIATLVRDSGARLLFTTPRFLPAVAEALPAADSPVEVVLLSGSAPERANLDEILAEKYPAPEPSPAPSGDPAVILYTSGTTSDPKGVVLTHGNLLAEIDAVLQILRVDHRDRILGVLPLFHALAQLANLLLPFTIGATVVFLESVNTTELLRALRERGITAFCCVPQFFYLIHQRVTGELAKAGWLKRASFRGLLALNGALRRTGVNLGKLFFRRVHAGLGPRMRYLVTGGSRFDPQIAADLYRMGFEILQAYGLTETSGAATVLRPGDPHIASVGTPLPGTDLRILPPDVTSEDATPGGEIIIRGPVVTPGYFNRPEVNAAVLRDGWFHSGDLGYLDPGGRLYITGRKKEIIVLSSGKNIYPEEIEAHYLHSPFIKELCVLGLARPGEPAAERLHAVLVPNMDVMRERKMVNTREILRFEMESLSIGLPSHKRVLSYEVVADDLPRTTTRKLKRFEIERQARQRAAAGVETPAAAQHPAQWSEEDAAWAAHPDVARAVEVIADAARYDRAVLPAANIELELGLDSMERVELLTHLQHLFGTQVSQEVASRIYTVRELVEAVRPQQGSGQGAAGAAGDAWCRLLESVPEHDPVLAPLKRPKPLFAVLKFVVMKLLYALAWLFLRFRVAGREYLPARGPFLLSPNHQSYLDAFLLVSALPFRLMRDLFYVGASEYFTSPFMLWFAREINLLPVDPDSSLVRAMQAGAYGLRHGKVLVLFPEGERSIDGTVKKFKKGASILSLQLKVPVVPVALDGVFDVWPRGRGFRWAMLWPWGDARIVMRFGPPLSPPAPLPAGASFSQAEAHYSAAAESLRGAVLEMWQTLRQPARV